ncbi:ewing's tumor-associated antigen 1 isoform X2 [Pseudophryne corroboree]|uniref:ewing's tumor-associated antigen 1 isoform X2 n=1 Tax=Pseudophryne corroboree TaxID=495146 RepID=UPI0030821085
MIRDLCPDNKTPKRLTKCKPWMSAINSPYNDAEQQQEIFWDPHSPAPFKLDNGKKKQAASKCSVDISDIVNRIAPKDEKPVNSDAAYLGVWIGDDAIPCTPVVSRTRTKKNRSSILPTEDELMKLAKQLDRNLIEHKDQHVDVLIDSANTMGTVKNSHDDSLLEDIPEEDDLLLDLKSVSQSSNVDVLPQISSQRSVDQDAEKALNDLFDSSTQKCSGRLSQGLSDVSTRSLHEVHVDATSCIEREILHFNHQQSCKKVTNSNQCSFSTTLNADASEGVNKYSMLNIVKPKDAVQSSDVVQSVSSSQDDFEDDWGTDLLDDDSFIMQITQNPDLIATPKNSMSMDKSGQTKVDNVRGKVIVKSITTSTSNKLNSFKFVPPKLNECNGKNSNLHSPELPNVKKTENNANYKNIKRAASGTGPQMMLKPEIHSGLQMTINSNSNLVRDGNPSNICELSKTSNVTKNFSFKSSTFREGKDLPVKECTQAVPQTHSSCITKDTVLMDEWDDPKFSDDVLDMFCESDSLWEEKEDDDDLLYQVCDDVERLTQVLITNESNCQKENALLPSSSCKAIANTRSNIDIASRQNKNESHAHKFNGHVEQCNKTNNKGASPATVSGNCSNSYQNKGFLRSKSVPSGVECKKPMLNESHSQNLLKPQTVTSNAASSCAPSKYSFTRMKPSQATSVHTKHPAAANESSFHSQDVGESKNKRSSFMQSSIHSSQQPSLKRHISESTLHSSKVFVSDDRNKRCSMEEIERKKQEALARRKMRVRACSNDSAPT